MNHGALCLKNMLLQRHFALTDERASALWDEVKAYWRKQDSDNPFNPEDLPEGFTLDEMTCEPLIREIEEWTSGVLDTLPRECLLEGIAKVTGGVEWPCNGDSSDVKNESFAKIKKGLAKRKINRVFTIKLQIP